MIEAGTSVEGYRVERLIGRGGMGVVYEAVQTSLERRVALKVLRPELVDDPGFVERFWREGQLQASLEHPHVLDVYEVGESEQGLFISMRLVTGQTLLDLLRDGELDAERSLKLLDQVTGALDFAHEAKLVHRDVKPQNVLIGEGDHAFLADFGLTRGSTDTTVASSGPMLGSVAYVAPEIVRGEEPTPASDRYSFAATVFHCLTGDVVFPLGSDAAVLFAHAAQPPPHPGERRPELPQDLDAVMDAALAKEPDSRPKSARSIMRAVRDAIGPRVSQLGSPQAVGPFERAIALPTMPPQQPEKRPGLKVATAAGVLLAGVALAAGAAFVLSDDEGSAADRPEVPLPVVQEGATALGSDLDIPDRSVDCDGEVATPRSTPCSIVQAELPGQDLLIPSDGVITGWTVRGAQGEIALDVIRPRGADTIRIARSQFEYAGNAAPHHFETRIPVEAGDQIGVQLTPGASIGVTDTEGATTLRWLEPVGGFYEAPDKEEGTGFDYEVALRAEFVPGAKVELPRFLTGAAAASAPDARVRDTAFAEVDKPSAKLRLELSEIDGKVVLDVFEKGKRNVRVFIQDLEPGGLPVDLRAHDAPGEPTIGAEVWWVNPTSGRMIFQAFSLTRESLEFAG
ncbi:MAG TPA: serine/threonine-protein kinase [Solirubrobacterales bacterium]|nr:serine/threonine-protein kinase [Solirubrobacterales bacterium]